MWQGHTIPHHTPRWPQNATHYQSGHPLDFEQKKTCSEYMFNGTLRVFFFFQTTISLSSYLLIPMGQRLGHNVSIWYMHSCNNETLLNEYYNHRQSQTLIKPPHSIRFDMQHECFLINGSVSHSSTSTHEPIQMGRFDSLDQMCDVATYSLRAKKHIFTSEYCKYIEKTSPPHGSENNNNLKPTKSIEHNAIVQSI